MITSRMKKLKNCSLFQDNQKANIVFDYPIMVEGDKIYNVKARNNLFKTYWHIFILQVVFP